MTQAGAQMFDESARVRENANFADHKLPLARDKKETAAAATVRLHAYSAVTIHEPVD